MKRLMSEKRFPPSGSCSLRLDTGIADDLGPGRDLGLDARALLIRCAEQRLIALQAELRDHIGRLHRLADLRIEPRDHGIWRAGWRRQSIPARDLEPW